MIFKAGLITIVSSLSLLFPSVGRVHNEPVFFKPIIPPKMVTLRQPTVNVVEAVQQVVGPQVVTYTTPALTMSYRGSHEDWMTQAGISPSDYQYVDFIISHESGWDPTNWYGKAQGLPYNPATSAAGLPQALPYSKTGCAWGDPICQLVWANGYATYKYGSWYNAYISWTINRIW